MDNTLKDALKKAKRKQLLKIIGISVLVVMIVVLILLPIFYKVGNHFAAKGSARLHDRLFLQHAVSEPNIRIDSQVTSNSSMFGGNIVTNRSKNIDGYVVQWSTLTSSYDWLRIDIDYNELAPGFYWSDTQFYEYDKQTKNKVATFYHPSIKNYFAVQHDLEGVSKMEDHVAEVAISFDRPYTWQDIQAKIPDNLNIVWLYMTSPLVDESKGPSGVQEIYGFDPGTSPEDAYEGFVDALERLHPDDETIQTFLASNKKKPFDDVPILGVMTTGQTKNFKALENQEFIRGSSVGATAEIVPYIKPEK